MVFKRFRDQQKVPYQPKDVQDRLENCRKYGAITDDDRFYAKRGFEKRVEMLKPYLYSIGEANHICARILYNMDGITIDHFKPYFVHEFDFSRLHIRGNMLVIDIPYESWKRLNRSFHRTRIPDIYRELNQYLSDAGIEEFFDEIRNSYYSFYSYEVRGQRTALAGVEQTLEMQKQANERRDAERLRRQQKRELSDFREVRNYKARELGRIGKV